MRTKVDLLRGLKERLATGPVAKLKEHDGRLRLVEQGAPYDGALRYRNGRTERYDAKARAWKPA